MSWFTLLFGPDGWAGLLLKGTVVTVLLAVTTVPFGFGAGLLLAIAKLARSPGTAHLLRRLHHVLPWHSRSACPVHHLFRPAGTFSSTESSTCWALKRRSNSSAFAAGVIALSVVVAAYSSEVWIASLAAVAPGQGEAARSLGLNRRQVFVLVTLPQLARVALPGLGNIWTILMKDTSLISTLALTDLLRAASEASRATTRPLVFYSSAAAIYLVFSIVSGLVQTHLERRANQGYA